MDGQRLDKWLWCARLTRTRTLAAKLIASGKIRINGERVLKPARPIVPGDVITASIGRIVVLRMLEPAERRLPASLAKALYEDLTPPTPPASEGKSSMRGPRPTKRDRRRLDTLRAERMDG